MPIRAILLLILYHGRYRNKNSGILEQEERLELFRDNIGSVNFRRGSIILTNVKIFQFPHSTCRVVGQHALCGKENLIVSEYKDPGFVGDAV